MGRFKKIKNFIGRIYNRNFNKKNNSVEMVLSNPAVYTEMVLSNTVGYTKALIKILFFNVCALIGFLTVVPIAFAKEVVEYTKQGGIKPILTYQNNRSWNQYFSQTYAKDYALIGAGLLVSAAFLLGTGLYVANYSIAPQISHNRSLDEWKQKTVSLEHENFHVKNQYKRCMNHTRQAFDLLDKQHEESSAHYKKFEVCTSKNIKLTDQIYKYEIEIIPSLEKNNSDLTKMLKAYQKRYPESKVKFVKKNESRLTPEFKQRLIDRKTTIKKANSLKVSSDNTTLK